MAPKGLTITYDSQRNLKQNQTSLCSTFPQQLTLPQIITTQHYEN